MVEGNKNIKDSNLSFRTLKTTAYSLVPKESNLILVLHITLIRPNTLSLKGTITLFWVNTKRKTVMTLVRIVLLSNGCAVITLFRIYLKIVMTDPFTFECHYSLLDHVKLKLQSWLSFGVSSFISVLSWLSLSTIYNPGVLPLPSYRTCLSFCTREYILWILNWKSCYTKNIANSLYSPVCTWKPTPKVKLGSA